MPLTFAFTEEQEATFTAILKDDVGVPIGSGTITTFKLTVTNQADNAIINNRFNQNALNANNVTLNVAGNVSWSIQALDNIIVNGFLMAGDVERHEILFEWTWGTSKYSNELYYFDVTQVSNVGNLGGSIYGTVTEADTYFVKKLRTDAWDDASNIERVAALSESARIIDNLNFKGDKTDSAQTLEFPRGIDTVVPDRIKWASFELAFALLDGSDINWEIDSSRASAQAYEGVRESYQNGTFPEYVAAGIISPISWLYLKPFLRDQRILLMSRES